MNEIFNSSLCIGYERLSAWSGLLDRINLYPVADADTGRNLKISLAALRWQRGTAQARIQALNVSATGNSGNIAAAFFAELIKAASPAELGPAMDRGRQKARRSVADPQPGTMLTVFDALAEAVSDRGWDPAPQRCEAIVRRLESCVRATSEILPVLRRAGVVDAGALGMFLFLEAFLLCLCGSARELRPVTEIFPGKLTPAPDAGRGIVDAEGRPRTGFCVDTLVESAQPPEEARRLLADCGHSLVLNAGAGRLKLHLHTQDRESLRGRLESLGRVLAWSEESLEGGDMSESRNQPAVHIMSDAAGSIAAADARAFGITLLHSYLVVGEQAWPETLFEPDRLYAAMRDGVRVSTAQASLFERRQSYLSALDRHQRVLYLCVGSAYTGNHAAAAAWLSEQNRRRRFALIDTGAASGRLGVIALATARYAEACAEPAAVLDFARAAVAQSQEYVFLEQLKYLAAGGRISKAGGFFGDLLNLRPVISPTDRGAVKVAVLRRRADQLLFAEQRLGACFGPQDAPLVMVQYSDNQAWVEEVPAARIRSLLPLAQVLVRPLSLTSGAHMGPGTWAVAFLPSAEKLAAA